MQKIDKMIRFSANRLSLNWTRIQPQSSCLARLTDGVREMPPWRSVAGQQRCFRVHPSVAEALRQRKPVVALESTIITHGMPYPQNVKTALKVEKIIKSENAIPATVGVIEGELIVGLTEQEIQFLGEPDSCTNKVKTSRRDLAYVLSQGLSGGTTVSGTIVAAEKAGISLFVTGGIGGVHRGASQSFDVSADLTELGKTAITVICAGIKSILDIGLTLQYLETQGVTVVTFGQDKEFPAFFTRKSGFKAPFNTDSPTELAQLIDQNMRLGLESGIIVGVPIPKAYSSGGDEIENIIQKALDDSRTSGIAGKDVTPFVLERVNQLTGGKSLEANIALIENNARVGAQIAVELSKIERGREIVTEEDVISGTPQDESFYFAQHTNKSHRKVDDSKPTQNRPTTAFLGNRMWHPYKIKDSSTLPIFEKHIRCWDGDKWNCRLCKVYAPQVVIGGSVFDLLAVTDKYDVLAEVTNIGRLYQTFGGVGRNIAECLARLDMKPLLISAVGEDSPGNMMLERLRALEMDTRGVLVSADTPTASYNAIMNNVGEILLAVGDMDIHDEIKPEYVLEFEDDIKKAPIVCIDGNLNTSVIEQTLNLCLKHEVPVWYEPTDMSKATKPFATDSCRGITYISPNKRELQALHAAICHRQEGMVNFNSSGPYDFTGPTEDQIISSCVRMSREILTKVRCLVITLGRFGVLVLRDELCDEPFPIKHNITGRRGTGLISATHYPSVNEDILPRKHIRSVSGAGDSLAGAMIASIIRGDEPHMCVKAGLHAAFLSLQTHDAISDQIYPDKFTVENIQDWVTLSPRDIAV